MLKRPSEHRLTVEERVAVVIAIAVAVGVHLAIFLGGSGIGYLAREEQKREHVKQFEAKLISPAEEALWKRGASNAGYHYLGCAKTFALMGKAFAEATLQMMNGQKR